MFGVFKSKKKKPSEKSVDTIAKELFSQIEVARDEAKAGGLVDEKVFNNRLNSMFVAGYLIGYVDEHLSSLFDDDASKKENAEKVFETMFPGAGIDFVKAKLVARQKASSITAEDENYTKIAAQCNAFDNGMSSAEAEVSEVQKGEEYQPVRLKEFLLLGEI